MYKELKWWQKTTVYQIYPRSFKDSNGDGIGDIPGIISKLDYIRDLGFETIWFSPFFCSPQADFGYDISDFMDVAPEYGTLMHVERLIDEIHKREMRVLFDLVMNHTSSEHPWFQDSRSSRDNPKRNWYIWRDGHGRKPPNNWKAIPGGSGWQYDQTTEQYYYASFLPFQPDLNYRNPEVIQAMFEVARFWLEKGVDGFRLDIFHSIYKDELFRDNPLSWRYLPKDGVEGYFQKWQYNLNLPEVKVFAKHFREYVNRYATDPLLIGEVFGPEKVVKAYLGEQLDGLNLLFLWGLIKLKPKSWFFREIILLYEKNYPEPNTPVYVYGNHDQMRVISKANEDHRIAMLLALFQFTVRGVPVTYYGEELGMVDAEPPAKSSMDPIGRKYAWVPKILLKLLGLYVNRDGCRTPMQWSAEANAGFSPEGAIPWLHVNPDYRQINVHDQTKDTKSILNTYKKLLRMRRELRALQEGEIELLDENKGDEDILAYLRIADLEQALVLINFSGKFVPYQNSTICRVVQLTIGLESPTDLIKLTLPPYSGIVLSN